MPTTAITDWGVATWTALTAGLASFYAFLPNLIGAILILLIGWGVASLLYTVTDKLLERVHFDALMTRLHVDDAIARSGTRIEPSALVASLVKWTVLLVAIMAAAERLNLTEVSVGIAGILAYIPNVVAAVLILTLGLLLASFVSSLVRGATASANVRASDLLADLSYWAIAIFAALGAIGQLNIAPTLVQTLYTAVIAAVALAAALAFGLGLRDQAGDLVAGQALSGQLRNGETVSIEHVQGQVEKVGTLTTLVRTKGGLVSVPNRMLAERIVQLGGGQRLATAGGGGGQGLATPEREDVELLDSHAHPMHPRVEHPWRPGEDLEPPPTDPME